MIGDTGNCAVGVPTLTTTLRGVANLDVTVSTLEGEVHSGMFGGPAPDALVLLTQMLATLHDERGNVTIDGLRSDQGWEVSSIRPTSSARTPACSTGSSWPATARWPRWSGRDRR